MPKKPASWEKSTNTIWTISIVASSLSGTVWTWARIPTIAMLRFMFIFKRTLYKCTKIIWMIVQAIRVVRTSTTSWLWLEAWGWLLMQNQPKLELISTNQLWNTILKKSAMTFKVWLGKLVERWDLLLDYLFFLSLNGSLITSKSTKSNNFSHNLITIKNNST